jgi:hypothetical protein
MAAPIVVKHGGIAVIRDDLIGGATKARPRGEEGVGGG